MHIIEATYPDELNICGNRVDFSAEGILPWEFHIDIGILDSEFVKEQALRNHEYRIVAFDGRGKFIAFGPSEEYVRRKAIVKGITPIIVGTRQWYSDRDLPEGFIEKAWPFQKYMSLMFAESRKPFANLKQRIEDNIPPECQGDIMVYQDEYGAKVHGCNASIDIYVTANVGFHTKSTIDKIV